MWLKSSPNLGNMVKSKDFETEVRRVSNLSSKRGIWAIRIPKKILDELDLRHKFVTIDVKSNKIIISKIKTGVNKKMDDILDSENTTSENTPSQEPEPKSEKESIIVKPSEPTPESSTEKIEIDDEKDEADKILDDIEKQNDENNTKEIKRKSESSTKKQNEEDRISKLIDDSVNQIEL